MLAAASWRVQIKRQADMLAAMHFVVFPFSSSWISLLSRLARGCLGIAWLFLMLLQVSHAQGARLDELPTGPLGQWVELLVEADAPLSLPEALALQRQGAFRATEAEVPKFGSGARPVWLHLAVLNTSDKPEPRRLLLEVSWLDRLELHHLQGEQVIGRWLAGDSDVSLQHPVPGLGFVFEPVFPPGQSDLYLRVATPDPLVLPLRLLTPAQVEVVQRQYNYGYGLLYGFLLALILYNAMLYLGLRDRGYLDYSLYLGSFALLNLCYTGHGYAWFWPQYPAFQQYVILVMMVFAGCLGLRFASGFLNLRQHAPRANLFVRGLMIAGLLAMSLSVLLQSQQTAVLIAFVFVLIFSVAMVWLGIITVQHGRVAGRYFLVAALSAMVGMATSALSVWVGLPYTQAGFHAAGWGVVIEGLLLTLALAYRMRQHQRARVEAEQLARLDSLTSLLNRRAFLECAGPLWSTALRNRRPLSVMMMDLDFFKKINDTYGHAMGDQVLVAASRVLAEACRNGDIAARWGGEEFIVALPETDATQALILAERLRGKIGALQLKKSGQPIKISASFGIVELGDHATLEALIDESDQWLYAAKKAGRNQVCGALLMQGG